MEILANKYKLGNNHPDTPLEKTYTKQDIIVKLIGFITLTEEDRLKAGIYVGNEGRDWIDRSALILSPPTDLK
jgi:hypothetical protein